MRSTIYTGQKVLITGVAGFIGMHTAYKLLMAGFDVVGIDNLNTYYDVRLKHYRLERLMLHKNFNFIELDLSDRNGMSSLFRSESFSKVIHLAAQAGVRYSIENPFAYIESNLVGMMTILEGCRHNDVDHLVYASSSSVYGMNSKIPFSEADRVDEPVSLYAATKKSNEVMAYSYSKLYGIPMTGLRFFTVYGPASRPDMAPWLFTEAIIEGRPIKLFNHGNMLRDFTYIDDIVEGIFRIQDRIPVGRVPHEIFNIGNNEPIALSRFIGAIESATGIQADRIMLDMQAGDVKRTYADTALLKSAVGYKPETDIETGVRKFVDWFMEYKEAK